MLPVLSLFNGSLLLALGRVAHLNPDDPLAARNFCPIFLPLLTIVSNSLTSLRVLLDVRTEVLVIIIPFLLTGSIRICSNLESQFHLSLGGGNNRGAEYTPKYL